MSRGLRPTSLVLLISVLVVFNAALPAASAYTPKGGDYFGYTETVTVNNGQGSYTGYSDQTKVTGSELMNYTLSDNVSSHYTYSYQFSDNQGSSTADSKPGDYIWSYLSRHYVNGTDNQVGYSNPYVWFYMDASLPVNGTFYVLNTQFTVLSKNFSFQLPANGSTYVQTIQARGTGQYQRNDVYGTFTASYTWYAYFDPVTGYIAGYNYVEQDNGAYQGSPGSFTYTDKLYVTESSYQLKPATPPNNAGAPTFDAATAALLAVAILFIFGIAYIVVRRSRRPKPLPQHSAYVPPTQPPTPWGPNVDMGSKPSQQVVIRDVAKVKCRYCGTLISTTVDTCPYCGGPRQ